MGKPGILIQIGGMRDRKHWREGDTFGTNKRTEVEARIHSITVFSRLPVDYKTSQIKRSPLAIGGRVVGSGGERWVPFNP